jgi:hypothetical protein
VNIQLHDKGQKPTIAILTVQDGSRIFRGDKRNFADIVKAGQEFGAEVYVITADKLKLTGNRMFGFRYNPDQRSWVSDWMPAPHVIYNRVPFRKMEMHPEVQQIIQACIRSNQVNLYNPSFFNKWSLFEWLNKSAHTRMYIPETEQLSSPFGLERLMRKHPVVYLKPIKGKAGKGIMRLERKIGKYNQPEYELCVQSNKVMVNRVHHSIDSLWKDVDERRGNKEYIMQQGITLTSYKHRAYDLRVLVQKNALGAWSVTGIGARVAGKLSITTHVPRGGFIEDPLKLLTHAFDQKEASSIMKRTKRAAVVLAKQIEKSSGHQLGEMSMDLGVDTSGRIWFFEANSKPMKFDEPDIRKKSLERIIHYGVYLTKKVRSR